MLCLFCTYTTEDFGCQVFIKLTNYNPNIIVLSKQTENKSKCYLCFMRDVTG